MAGLAGVLTVADRPDETPAAPADLGITPADLAQAREAVPGAVDVLPLTPLQEGLYFHHQFDTTGLDYYNAQLVLEFRGTLDPAALRAATDTVLTRHASLRAGFHQSESGRALAVLAAEARAPWREVDLTDRAEPEREAACEALLDEDRWTRFDLSHPPLVRLTLVRLTPDRTVLVLTNHHIILDGWSLPLVVRDVLALYAASTRPVRTPPGCRRYAPTATTWTGSPSRTATRRSRPGVRHWPEWTSRPGWPLPYPAPRRMGPEAGGVLAVRGDHGPARAHRAHGRRHAQHRRPGRLGRGARPPHGP